MDFTFTCDNPAFAVASGDRQNVAAKSSKSVTVKFSPPQVRFLPRYLNCTYQPSQPTQICVVCALVDVISDAQSVSASPLKPLDYVSPIPPVCRCSVEHNMGILATTLHLPARADGSMNAFVPAQGKFIVHLLGKGFYK